MTFEEAKKILEKEFAVIGIHKSTEPFEFDESGWIEHEKPSVLEAFRVLSKEGYYITISGHDYNMRKKRLEKEYEKNTKAPGPGEEQSKEGNPALEESASKFNDALLDEQAKKIAELTKEKANLEDQITVLNACKKHNDKIDRKQIKCLGKEIAKLNGIIHDKNAVLADVAEELRLSKIREKNLTELCQKYVKEVEDLRERLADKVVDKIDAQALKSAESALAYKEKVIAEKDEVIADLGKELAAQKDLVDDISLKYDGAKYNLKLRIEECEELKKLLADKVDNGIDWKRNAEAIKLYVNRASRERLWNTVNQDICNEKELSFIINHGGKRMKYALRFDGTDIVYECSDPDKKPSFFRDDSVGAVTNLKDCSLAKDTVDIAEEGADHSGVIVLCGKDFVDAIKKMK